MTRLDTFLFAPADPRVVARFRLLLALFLAYTSWPRGVPAGAVVETWPLLSGLYQGIFLRTSYHLAIGAVLVWFATGWRPRLGGVLLFLLLLPFEFLGKGRVSTQIQLAIVLLTTLMPAEPLWRTNQSALSRPAPMWPVRLMQWQLTLLYGVNAIRKVTPEYLSGEVLRTLSMTRGNFIADLSHGYLPLGPWLVPLSMAALAVVVVEFVLAVGWWIPRGRWPTAILGVSFHVFLKLFVIDIFMLDATAVFLYLVFLLPFRTSAHETTARAYRADGLHPVPGGPEGPPLPQSDVRTALPPATT